MATAAAGRWAELSRGIGCSFDVKRHLCHVNAIFRRVFD